MLFKKMAVIYCGNGMEYITKICGPNEKFSNAELSATYNNNCASCG
jgi:hypothetical protein